MKAIVRDHAPTVQGRTVATVTASSRLRCCATIGISTSSSRLKLASPCSVTLRPPPSEHLDPKARTLWRLSALLGWLPILLLAVGGTVALWWFDRSWWLIVLPIPAALVTGVFTIWIMPDLTWKHWRYEVGEDEVDLLHGVITRTRTLIPMARIQHVDTRRGPLQRRYGLASVILFTAAGASEIPALADPIAEEVRDRIARLANTREEL